MSIYELKMAYQSVCSIAPQNEQERAARYMDLEVIDAVLDQKVIDALLANRR